MRHQARVAAMTVGALVLAACGAENDSEPASQTTASAEAVLVKADPVSSQDITCSHPVRPNDTAAKLHERFGAQARAETLYGPEGIELAAMVLWPDDPARRVEVILAEDAMRSVSLVSVSQNSDWRVAGLAVGDPLARVNEANGKPVGLWGFGWDYGGYVTDLNGGELASLPDGCRLMMRVGPPEHAELADGLVGEVELTSDDPRLAAADVRIEELTLRLDPE